MNRLPNSEVHRLGLILVRRIDGRPGIAFRELISGLKIDPHMLRRLLWKLEAQRLITSRMQRISEDAPRGLRHRVRCFYPSAALEA